MPILHSISLRRALEIKALREANAQKKTTQNEESRGDEKQSTKFNLSDGSEEELEKNIAETTRQYRRDADENDKN
jgi:hypothetical protein